MCFVFVRIKTYAIHDYFCFIHEIRSYIKIINRDIISLRNNIKDQITKTLQNSESNNIYKSFFINFDSLFDTENSVTQLKEIILKLAITGKLTLQNPKDNTITELIKKINLHYYLYIVIFP